MKKYIILILLTLILTSCNLNKEQSYIKESWDIVEWYIDTLETSVQSSKEVKDLIENNQNELIKEINSIK